MDCATCREALSARLDGEHDAADGSLVDLHLRDCAECRRFADGAAHITRLVRTGLATEVPDLVPVVLAAAPRSRLPRPITVLRVLLGLVGVAQLGVALTGVLTVWTGGYSYDGQAHLSGASLAHFAHESAAWNLALGVGFLWVAWRSSRTSGVVPTVTTFVVVLTVLEMIDLAAGRVDPQRLLMHCLVQVGLLLVIVLDRRRPPSWGTVPGGTRSGWHWSSPVPQTGSEIDGDTGSLPGLRPTARHRGTAAAATRDDPPAVAQRRTA